MLDTARASDIYKNNSLKTINNLTKKGIKYENAIAPGTWTAPSHASIFSGRHISNIPEASKNMFKDGTRKIDIWFVKTKFLSKNSDTLASKLSRIGYSTTLLSNNPFVNRFTNLVIGFNHCYDLWETTNLKDKNIFSRKVVSILKNGMSARLKMMDLSYSASRLIPKSILDRVYLTLRLRMDKGVAEADGTYGLDRGAAYTNKVIKEHFKKIRKFDTLPHFMFINYIEPHENYPVADKKLIQDKWIYLSGIKKLSSEITKQLHNGYLKRLKYLDLKIAEALNILKRNGKLDNALVIITSDHGQFFGEHNLLYHSQFPYSEISRVPLISTRFIDGSIVSDRKVIETPASLTYLGKSILDVANNKSQNLNEKMFGNTFIEHTGISEGWDEYLLKKLKDRSEYANMIYNTKNKHNQKATTVYGSKYKLVHFYKSKKDELYLTNDTGEMDNLIGQNRTEAKVLLRKYYASI